VSATQSDFEAQREFMMKRTSGDEKLAALRTMFLGAFWLMKLGVRDDVLQDLTDILRFERDLRLDRKPHP